MRRAVLAALLLSLVGAPGASAELELSANTSQRPGWIGFYVVGTGAFTHVDIAEQVSGTSVPLRSVVPPTSLSGPDHSMVSYGYYPDVVQWRCDRLTRSFTATGYRSDGSTEAAAFAVSTPSCRNRLALITPRRVRPGARVRIRVRDEFELGGTSARVCVRPPDRPRHCRVVRLVGTEASESFVAGRGYSAVSLTSRYEHVQTVVSAGVPPRSGQAPLPVVLATGDSMMQSVDAQLTDMLAGRADVRSDVHVGSALSSDAVVSWSTLPGRQVRRFHPRATVLFLGANEGFPMTTPEGTVVRCCGPPYVAEYARRIRLATRTYLRDGGKAVIWLDVPFMRDPARNLSIAAIDAALYEGVSGIRGATVLDMAGLFTPGGVFRDHMTVNGRTVRVRESDGIHLSPQGAAIAADDVIQELARLGVI